MSWRDKWASAQKRLAAFPHLPIAAWLAVAGIFGIPEGGLVPGSMEEALPVWLTQSWTLGIALGGVFVIWGCLSTHTRVESAGLGLIIYGVCLYGAVAGVTAWPSSLAVVMLCTSIASMCAIRLRVLSLSRKVERDFGGTDGC